jgi:hypothetical protein
MIGTSWFWTVTAMTEPAAVPLAPAPFDLDPT